MTATKHLRALDTGLAEARQAFRLGNNEIGFARIKKLLEVFPDEHLPNALMIEQLINLRRLDDAERFAVATLAKFPVGQWVWHWSAFLSEYRTEYAKAFQRWAHLASFAPSGETRNGLIRTAARLQRFELLDQVLNDQSAEVPVEAIDAPNFRNPPDLRSTPTNFRRGLIIGSCLTAGLPETFCSIEPTCKTDFILFNNVGSLPASPPQSIDDYDFQIIQIPLRFLITDAAAFRISFGELLEIESIFDQACERLDLALRETLRWNTESGLISFVANFLVPQQNPLGKLLPRNDLRNLVFFFERLNQVLIENLSERRGVYLLDLDQIAATLGKRFVQDDHAWMFNHGASLSDWDHELDGDRLEPLKPMLHYYPDRDAAFPKVVWREIEAMWRTIRQIDLVKMVLVDLDDTLWRGVLAETGTTDLEGWPKGLAEALLYLRRRGVILGIVSKNSEQRVLDLWHHAFGSLLPIETFALRRINWAPKAENVASLLQEANLLPRSVVFIDNNPVERAAVTAAFPDIRVLGANPYLLRRILLWSAETQVPVITTESATRGDMIRAQSERERTRATLTRAEFLTSLGVRITLVEISSPVDARFPRAFELLNKTNQFNTTGRRWSSGDAERFFKDDGMFLAVEVADKFTHYGLVAVLCVTGDHIEQFVMSCRVVGLDVEPAVVAWLLAMLKGRGLTSVRADLVETEANLLSRDIWSRTGFAPDGSGHFLHGLAVLPEIPDHVTVETVATQGDRRVGSAA